MDQFGIFEAKTEDWDVIVKNLRMWQTIVFPYCPDTVTCYIITIAKNPEKIGGPLPWGGQVKNMMLVSLRRIGSEFFELENVSEELHPNYVGEKLNLNEGDSKPIAELLTQIRKRLNTQANGD